MSSSGPRGSEAAPTPRISARERREQILEAGVRCFADRGFRGTTTRELAACVGITEAALYRYFPSKRALYDAIVDRKMSAPDPVAALRPAADRRDDEALFRELAQGLFERVEADPAFLRILWFTALEGHALAEPFFESRVRRLREFVADYIAIRSEEGAFLPLDPQLAARAFLGMVFDHIHVRLVFGQQAVYPQPTREVVETFVGIFLRGMRDPAGDPKP